MDVKMNLPLLSALRAQQTGGAAPATGGAASSGKAGGAEFAQSLKQALSSVSQAQNQAGRMQREFQAGTEGVGLSTTRTVVAVSISILIADFLLTKLFMLFMPMGGA